MFVLLILQPVDSAFQAQFHKGITNALRASGHEFALLQADSLGDRQSLHTCPVDLIVVDLLSTQLALLTHPLYAEKPVVFIAHGEDVHAQPMQQPTLMQVICTYGRQLDNSAIPKERISYVDPLLSTEMSLTSAEYTTQNAPICLAYIDQDADVNTQVLKSVLRFANRNMHVRLDVYTRNQIISLARSLCNHNIEIREIGQWVREPDLVQNYSLILAGGFDAQLAIGQARPTLVLGKCGLGGFVNPADLQQYVKARFSGRLGGEPEEPIPYWALYDALDQFEEQRAEVEAQAQQNAILLQQLTVKQSIWNKIIEVIQHAQTNQNREITAATLQLIRPKLCRNISLEQSIQVGCFDIKCANDLYVGTIGAKEQRLLVQFDGTRSLQAVAEAEGYDEQEMVELAQYLLESNIITS